MMSAEHHSQNEFDAATKEFVKAYIHMHALTRG